MNFFRPFRAYRPYKLFGAGGAGGALPSFRAFTYDSSTYELLNYHSGEGDVETDRVAPINVPDMNGVYPEIPGGQIAYPGARIVRNLALWSQDLSSAYFGAVTFDGNVATVTTKWSAAYYLDYTALGIDATVGGINYTVSFDYEYISGQDTACFTYRRDYITGGNSTFVEELPVVGGRNRLSFSISNLSNTFLYNLYIGQLRTGPVEPMVVYINNIVVELETSTPANPIYTNGTQVVVQYANTNGNTVVDNIVIEAPGTLLDPIPSALVAPRATNYFLNSRASVTQDVAGRNGVHTVSVIGTGTVTLSGGLTGVVSEGSSVTGDPAMATVTCTVAGTPDNVQFEDSPYVTQPIYTTTVPVTRDKDEIIIDNANLNATEGSIYFKVTPGQDTTNLLDGFLSLVNGFVVIDDGTNAVAAAALVDTGVESDVGMVWSAAGMKCCANGTWSPLVGYDGTMNDGVLDLFRDATASNQMRELQIWDSAEEQAITDLMPAAEDWGTDFVMVVKTTTAGESFTLPCGDTGTYNANIDWDDGEPNSTITTYNDADLTHTFAEAGNHTIRISGVLPWIYFNNGGDRLKVIGVFNGGSIGSRSCSGMFNGCSNLTAMVVSGLVDKIPVTNMSSMFRNCSSLTTIDVSGVVDTTRVTNMSSMFRGCSNLTTLDVSGFDTARVTSMAYMFNGCSSLVTLAGEVIGNADIVSNTTGMFTITTALSQASLDDILAKMYANRANYTWATPILDLSAPTAVPSGVYQDATPPTTGEEFRYKLENDPDGEGFNTWTITV